MRVCNVKSLGKKDREGYVRSAHLHLELLAPEALRLRRWVRDDENLGLGAVLVRHLDQHLPEAIKQARRVALPPVLLGRVDAADVQDELTRLRTKQELERDGADHASALWLRLHDDGQLVSSRCGTRKQVLGNRDASAVASVVDAGNVEARQIRKRDALKARVARTGRAPNGWRLRQQMRHAAWE